MTCTLTPPKNRAVPRFLSPIPEGTDIEVAHIGARLQRMPMTPQGEIIAGVLQSRNSSGALRYKQNTIQVPRRSTKTTSIQNVLLGRCLTIPGYQVVSTAQDGTRASQFFRDMMDLIEEHANEIVELRNEERAAAYEGDKEPEEFTFKDALRELGIRTLYYSQQREYIRFLNGSKWRVAKPEPSSLRGGAAHVIWFDEGGELDVEGSPRLLAGALPMMDTKPEGQIIISGTPGTARAGMFWQAIERSRLAPERLGIVDYSADEFCDPNDEEVWWEVHPGLSCGLTTIETIRERHDPETGLSLPEFMREYLCIWPPDSMVTALNMRNWETTMCEPVAAPVDVPWAIGYDVEIGGHAAAVAVAWVDADGDPHIQMMDHRPGTQWLEAYLAKAISKHPKALIGYDNIGDNITVAQGLGRLPRFKHAALKALPLRDVAAGTAFVAQSLDRLALHHTRHGGLDAAVQAAGWRESAGSRLFARGKGRDISCLLACTHALAVASTMRRTKRIEIPKAAV